MSLSLTNLRNNLYKIMDKVIETGQPIEIVRRNKIIKIAVKKSNYSKLAHLKKHPGTIVGDPESLVHMDWSENWREEKNL